VAGRGGQGGSGDRAFDLCDSRQPVAVPVGDVDAVRVDDAQVRLDQPEHVEVVEEARRAVKAVE